MISFEKASELKNSGFPQRGWGFRACEHNKEALKHITRCDCLIADLISVPSLGEIIQECRKEGTWFQLKDLGIKWIAFIELENEKELMAFGSSPDEACSTLWLKIKEFRRQQNVIR